MITQTDIENFYTEKSADKPKTFFQNYADPVIRTIKSCMATKKDVIKCLKTPEKVFEDIYKRSENVNTRKVYLQAILWLIDNYPDMKSKVPREKYFDEWNKAKLITTEAPAKEYEMIPSADIQKKVDEKFGEESMESLFLSFFREVPMRLDYQNIMFENAEKFLDLKKGEVTFTTWNKTAKNKEPKVIKLSAELLKKVSESLKKEPRDQLFIFSNQNPTKAVSNILKGAGLDMTMNGLRHILANEDVETIEKKVEKAKVMGHSPATGSKYRSQIKGDKTTFEVPNEHAEAIEKLIQDYLSRV